MKKLLLLLAAFVFAASLARAGNVTTYPNVSSVTSADLFFDWQSGTQQNATAAQLKTYLLGGGSLSLASGKTLAANNTLTFAGTDGSSVNFGGGGSVLYSLGIGTSTEAWSARLDALAALSSPSTSGYLLSSTSSGALTWLPPATAATASGTNTYTATPSPALSAYATGLCVIIKFTYANTGGASLNLNGLGAVTIQQAGIALTAGQIPAGSTFQLVYDGTYFQIVGSQAPTIGSSGGVEAWSAKLDTLAALTMPGTSGYVLSSTTGGTLSWVAQGGGYTFTAPLVNTSGTVALTIGSSGGVEAWNAQLDSLAALSPPGTSGYVLSSTTGGTLSWVAQSGGSLSVGSNAIGYVTITGGVLSFNNAVNNTGNSLVALDPVTASLDYPNFSGTCPIADLSQNLYVGVSGYGELMDANSSAGGIGMQLVNVGSTEAEWVNAHEVVVDAATSGTVNWCSDETSDANGTATVVHYLSSGSTIASLTIERPTSNVSPGETFILNSKSAVTALTISGGMTVSGASVTSLTAGQTIAYVAIDYSDDFIRLY